jgi:hypothetical protein
MAQSPKRAASWPGVVVVTLGLSLIKRETWVTGIPKTALSISNCCGPTFGASTESDSLTSSGGEGSVLSKGRPSVQAWNPGTLPPPDANLLSRSPCLVLRHVCTQYVSSKAGPKLGVPLFHTTPALSAHLARGVLGMKIPRFPRSQFPLATQAKSLDKPALPSAS